MMSSPLGPMPFSIYGLAAAAAGFSPSGTSNPFTSSINGVGGHPGMGYFAGLHNGSIVSMAGSGGMFHH